MPNGSLVKTTGPASEVSAISHLLRAGNATSRRRGANTLKGKNPFGGNKPAQPRRGSPRKRRFSVGRKTGSRFMPSTMLGQ